MDTKSYTISDFKALSSKDEPGTFEALVSVFGNVDAGGDRVQRGAFKRTLGEWEAKGRSVPVLWSHDAESVPIGVVAKAGESNDGLRVKARLFVEGHDRAREVYEAMKGGALQEFSFGYGVKEHKDIVENGQPVRILKDLDLFEVSPVFRGMNPATRLMGVKSLPARIEELEAEIADRQRQISELKTAAEAVAEPEPAEQPEKTEEKEPEDNPEPNPAEPVGEEAKARIRALQAARPQHLE